MSLVSMPLLLKHARENKYAVGYFESWNLESILSVIDAAEKMNSPVIIGFGGMFLDNRERLIPENIYHYGALGKAIAEQAKVPVALLLNEADEIPILVKGLKAGFNAVMYVKEHAPLEHIIEVNKYLVRTAHYCGASVEAEIGELPSADISTNILSEGRNTDPDEAAYFVEQTGVDALAVAIGNVHLLEGRKSSIDFELLKTLRERVSTPLVLHGGTGVSGEDFRTLIELGISKVNVGTGLKRIFINTLRDYLNNNGLDKLDPHDIIGKGGQKDMLCRARTAMTEEIISFMKLFRSENQAKKM